MMNIFAESIFTATRIPPYDPTGMNPYAGTELPARKKIHKQEGWVLFRTYKKLKD